jgi:hypothetical protein
MKQASNETIVDREEASFWRILQSQLARYPLLQIEDAYKLLHQGAFGSEHVVKDAAAARSWLEREVAQLGVGPKEPEVEAISTDGLIVRVNLRPFVAAGGDCYALLEAFLRTARDYRGDVERLVRAEKHLEMMAEVGAFPFRRKDVAEFFEQMAGRGYPAVHHSTIYEEAYHPAYRVIARDYWTSADE